MAEHAKCSASGAHRWLNCTMSPTYEAGFPDKDPGKYAQEGTLAHRICELVASYNAGQMPKADYMRELAACQADPIYDPEMLITAGVYGQYLWEKATGFPSKPYQRQEVRVDFSRYVPGGFGTSDCIMIGGGDLLIVDYKHGEGVPVSAEGNPQMRLYALGALDKYGALFSIERVTMAIIQPRIRAEPDEETITADELRAWGESIRPIAQKAATGIGAEFREGPWCRFCKGRAVCRARADNMTALEDFMGLPVGGKMTEQEKEDRTASERMGFSVPPERMGFSAPHVLTDAEVGELLLRGERIAAWLGDLQEYARKAILDGKSIPGWKLVEGKSNRCWDDEDAAFGDLRAAGLMDDDLYKLEPRTLSQIEKAMGKAAFAKACGAHVVKPPGKPTLVPESDARAPWNAAAADFKGVAG